MKEAEMTYTTTPASSFKMLQAMVGIGIICALLIVLIYEGTLPRIERLRTEALEKAIFKVIPGITQTKSFMLNPDNTFTVLENEETQGQVVYAGFDDAGKLIGIAIESSGQGYADILRILYGYDPQAQKIIGFHVLESKETPGLGDKIEKDPNFLANFKALDVELAESKTELKNTVVTVKSGTKSNPWEIDGITGATISSRAIGDIIGASSQHLIPLLHQSQEVFERK